MNAPTPLIILVPFDAGSPKEARRFRPPPYPVQRRDQWLRKAIPKHVPDPAQIEEIKRRGREVLDAVRARRA
jgi:hypothetical protein